MNEEILPWGKRLVAVSVLAMAASAQASELVNALQAGDVSGEFRLRYEDVEQDNALEDAQAITLRTQLTYTTGTVGNFSALLEMEDVRVVGGVDDYTVGPTGFNPGEFSVIPDPETTELDQAFLQYKIDDFVLRGGRQVIILRDHRFVGTVGWRQDRQTFDALSAVYEPAEALKLSYVFIGQRNRIFAEAADVDSEDHLIDIGYKIPGGELAGFAYLLEVDNNTDNRLDTYGISFDGKAGSDAVSFVYAAKLATQEAGAGGAEFDANYWFAEGGVALPFATFKLGYEVLGSDDGLYGFSTPLATLHKFNGWADIFLRTPSQGLVDAYLSVSGKLAKGNWAIVYHDFAADEDTAIVDDFGEELDLQFVWPFGKNFSVGAKYAAYDAGDVGTGLVDTDKFWLWTSLNF